MSDDAEIRLACRLIENEALRAIKIFPPFNSGHEGKAVIEEELEELWEKVKKYPNANVDQMREEAIQIGAMAARFVADICPSPIKLVAPPARDGSRGMNKLDEIEADLKGASGTHLGHWADSHGSLLTRAVRQLGLAHTQRSSWNDLPVDGDAYWDKEHCCYQPIDADVLELIGTQRKKLSEETMK